MISLRKASEMEELRSSLLHAASLILEGVALHAVEIEGNDRGIFQDRIRRHAQELVDAKPAETMLAVGAAIQSMEAFARKTEGQVRAQIHEIRAIVAMLAAALTRACSGNHSAIAGIQSIERRMKGASQLDDIRDIKRELADCLAGLGKELERQAAEAAANDAIASKALSDPMVQLATKETGDADGDAHADLVTGLPGVPQAKSAIAESLNAGHWAAVVAAVERIEAINSRFGREVGDQVMLFMSRHLASKLRPSDQIFRWHGPLFLALIERADPVEAIRVEMTRALTSRVEHTIVIGGRSILVPLSLSWTVVPLWNQDGAEEVYRQIDQLLKRK